LRAGRFHRWLLAPTRWLFHLNAWAMVEVFAIGVIISLVKLAAMAKVSLGPSFWAYLAFTVLFLLAFSAMDRLTVWRDIEGLGGRST
jgi:paraquat-inducible protein A